jgi:hypothetical protein
LQRHSNHVQCVSFENEITRNTPHYATVTDVIHKVFPKKYGSERYKNLQNFKNICWQQRFGLYAKWMNKIKLITRAAWTIQVTWACVYRRNHGIHWTFEILMVHTATEMFHFKRLIPNSYNKSQQCALYLNFILVNNSTFWTDLLSIIRRLNTVFTAIGQFHPNLTSRRRHN